MEKPEWRREVKWDKIWDEAEGKDREKLNIFSAAIIIEIITEQQTRHEWTGQIGIFIIKRNCYKNSHLNRPYCSGSFTSQGEIYYPVMYDPVYIIMSMCHLSIYLQSTVLDHNVYKQRK